MVGTVKTSVKFRIVDLFAGIGGLRNGVVEAITSQGDTAEIVFVSEIKKTAIETLKENHPGQTIHGDITKVTAQEIPNHDILLAGFPCQAFSYAGLRKGFQDPTKGTLFFDVARILKAKRPHYFILENVEGLITHDKDPLNLRQPYGRTLKTILQTLSQLGYHTSWGLLNAANFGVPQSRKRVFIVGSLNETPNLPTNTAVTPLNAILEKGKTETDPKVIAFSKLLTKNYPGNTLIGKVIRDKRGGPNNIHSWDIGVRGVTTPEEQELLEKISLESRKKSWATRKQIPYKEGMPFTPQEIATFYTPPGKHNLLTMLNRLTKLGYLHQNNNQYRIYSGRLSFPISHILDPNKPTPTLVATDADRLTVLDGSNLRRLTNVEIKRLFGFKDTFKIPTSLTRKQIFDLFGNSVVSPVACEVAKKLLY